MKKKIRNILFFGGVLLLLLAILIGGGLYVQQSAFDDTQTVYKRNWGNIECVKADKETSFKNTLDKQQEYLCNDYTDKCSFDIINLKTGTFEFNVHGKYKICKIDNSECTNWIDYIVKKKTLPLEINNIEVGKKLVVYNGVLQVDEDQIQIVKKYNLWYIVGVEDGFKFTQNSCILSENLRNKVPKDGLNELSFEGTNKFQNYVIDWTVAERHTYDYKGQKVMCQARQLFKLEEITTKNNVERLMQGDLIKPVNCCPQEANCDSSSFTFKLDNQRKCFNNQDCPNGGNPIATSINTYIKHECKDGFCTQSKPVTIECTSTQRCIELHGEGYVCDLSLNNYGKCKVGSKAPYCGDKICQVTESFDSCKSDCGCPSGESPVTTIEQYDCAFLNIGCKERTISSCEPPKPDTLLWIIIGGVILIALVLILTSKPKQYQQGGMNYGRT